MSSFYDADIYSKPLDNSWMPDYVIYILMQENRRRLAEMWIKCSQSPVPRETKLLLAPLYASIFHTSTKLVNVIDVSLC